MARRATATFRDRYLPRPGHVAIEQTIAAILAYAAVDEPTSREVVEGWLDRVMLAVVNPPDPDERGARMAAIIALAGDFPRLCWTMETWKAFLRRGPDAKFWPGAADVDGFLRLIADQHRAKIATLRRIAAGGSTPERTEPSRPEPVSEAARMTAAEISAAVKAIRAKYGVPRRPANDGEKADRTPVPIHSVPVDPVALKAFRARCRAALGLAPLPNATPPSTKGA